MTKLPKLAFTPQTRKPLSDQIFESIRESIVTLRLEPGSYVYENELSDVLQVSRTPIRAALQRLVTEQLIEVLPQRGTQITRISERKVEEACFVRELLETGAFKLAAKLWEDADRTTEEEAFNRLLAQQAQAAEAGDTAQFLQLDEEFHRAILRLTNNETLLQTVGHMRAHINRARYLAMRELSSMGAIIDEHTNMLKVLKEGNQEQTAALLAAHIGKIHAELKQLRERYPDYFTD